LTLDTPCYNPEDNSCNFLDFKKYLSMMAKSELIYIGKTLILLPTSAHPNHIPSNIIYSMAFRLLRICDNEELFEE